MKALTDASRPVGLLTLQKKDEFSLGAAFIFLMLATAVAGELYDVNAYDQPGVEASKRRAEELLTRL
jgi:glucose-6-phosphate isomerase